MARLERGARRWLIHAESDEEKALLASGRQRGGHLTLEDAVYPLDGDSLVLPAELSEGAALKMSAAFERAARAHSVAVARRANLRPA